MQPVKPDTTKLDPSQAWPFGANAETLTEAEQLAEFIANAEEAPL
jgi:hypothetical protein